MNAGDLSKWKEYAIAAQPRERTFFRLMTMVNLKQLISLKAILPLHLLFTAISKHIRTTCTVFAMKD